MIPANRLASAGNATIEVVVALLALSPLLVGIPLLGKQLDVKHKAYDAARYSVWERTVWASAGTRNRKGEEEIHAETRDRVAGDPRSGLVSGAVIRGQGVSENMLWRDKRNRRLVAGRDGVGGIQLDLGEKASPVDVGYWFVPGVAHGLNAAGTVGSALQVRNLGLDRNAFAIASASIELRPVLQEASSTPPSLDPTSDAEKPSDRLVQHAAGAILGDTWSSRDEVTMRQRVDEATADELIEELERPGRIIGMQARGKGAPLYGEGQYGWDPDLRPLSATLPAAYIDRR